MTAERMERLGTESAFTVLARAEARRREGRPVINLGIGAPDFPTPEHIVEAGRRALADGWHRYTPAAGIPELREAVAEDVARHRGVQIDPGRVLIVPGGKPTMFFAMLMLGEPGTEILYPDPGFPIYRSMIEFAGADPVPIRLDPSRGFGFDPEQVLASITPRTRLVILNSPANPTGGVVDRAAIDALVEGLAAHPEVYLLSDEIYSRIVFGGATHTSLLGYPELTDRLIVLDGWSKTYAMTGWRLGWGYWPASLFEGAERLQINSTSCASAGVQVAGIEALRGPQDAVDSMVAAFEQRAAFVGSALDGMPGVSCAQPTGAFYAFPDITGTGLGSDELTDRLLEEQDVAVVPGPSFGIHGEGFIRISCAASMSELETAMERIADLLESA